MFFLQNILGDPTVSWAIFFFWIKSESSDVAMLQYGICEDQQLVSDYGIKIITSRLDKYILNVYTICDVLCKFI